MAAAGGCSVRGDEAPRPAATRAAYLHRAEKFLAAAAGASRRLGHDYIGTEHVRGRSPLRRDSESAPDRAGRRPGHVSCIEAPERFTAELEAFLRRV